MHPAFLLEQELKHLPLHQQMQRINETHADVIKPFAKVDIVFAEFVAFLQDNASQRERDMVIVSESLSRSWQIVHVSMQTLGEKPTPGDKKSLTQLMAALERLDLQHLMLDGLNRKMTSWLKGLTPAN